jgi:chitodextrinase
MGLADPMGSVRASAHRGWTRAAGRALRLPIGVTLAVVILLAYTAAVPSSASADTSVPTQPGAITVSGVTSNSASLSWGASTDDVKVEGYRVYRGPASAQNSSLSLIATTDAVKSYNAAALYAGTAYKFGIIAIDLANNMSPMTTTTFTTSSSSDTTAPAAPSSPSVSATAFSSSRIDVVWGASSSSDESGYLVFRDGTQVGRIDLPGGLRFSDNGLAPSSSHSYVIKTVDSAGNVSTGTAPRSRATLATGSVKIARGPYISNATASSAVVSWWTNLPTSGIVNYGVSSTSEQSRSDPAGTVQHHAVTLSGLTAGTTYSYAVVSGSASASATFKTAASPGTTFSFAAIGDFGGGSPGESQNAANIAAAGTSFIQTLGDNIYPSSGLPDPDFATKYSDFDARFFKPFGAAVKSQSFFPANGNKEYYGDGEFWEAFPMLGSNHSWYSYDWGDAHILVIDSEQLFSLGTDEYNFIQADLAGHQSATWRIVAIQRPAYSSSSANASSKPVLQYLVPLFEQYKVALVLSGNSHNYERSYPLLGGSVASSGGVTYVVSGAGGNGFNQFTIAQPAWSAFREASYYEFAKVTVSPTSLKVDGIRADTNSVFDSTTITASAPDATPPSAPSGLSADATGSSQIDLSWSASSDNVGVTGYEIWRGPAGGTLTKIATTSGTGASYSDATVAASTSYDYQLKAFDAVGNISGPSNTAAVTTPAAPETQPPTTPSNLHVTGTAQTSISLAWDASTDNVGVAGYDIYVNNTRVDSTANTTYTANGLTCGTTYNVAVEAYDAAGNTSGRATVAGATDACPAAAIAFVNQQNFSGATGSPTASLGYTGGTAGHFYILMIATALGASGNIPAVTDSGGNTWTRSTQLGVSGGTNTFLSIWRMPTAVAAPGTITVTGIGANAWEAKVVEFSGVGAVDAAAAAQANSTASTSLSTPSTTTTNAGSVLIAVGVSGGTKSANPTGWTPLTDVTTQTPHLFSAYRLPGTTGSYSATWTITSAKSTGGIASFLPS